MSVINVSTFSDLTNSSKPYAVCFTAERCPHCRAYLPLFTEFSEKYTNYVFASVDVDIVQNLAEQFNIRAIPATLIIKNGAVVARASGALTRHVLSELLTNPETADMPVR